MSLPTRSLKMLDSECPVCYTICKTSQSVMDGWCIEEHYEDCPNGCYGYEYAYGVHKTHFTIRGQHIEIGGHWQDSPADCRANSDAFGLIVKAAQRAQLEDYWKLVHGATC